MYPDQRNQNGYTPGPPQRHANGQYEVVPPINNTGATGHNPYDFIVAPNTPKRGIKLGGGSFGKQIGIFAGIAVLIVIVLGLLFSALSPKGNTPALIAIAQRQQEIIRIATDATKQVSTTDASNFVGNTEITVGSSQQQLLSYLQAHGTKLSSKTLALDQDAKTDNLLTNAASAGNYDSTVTQTLASQLDTYQSLLKTAYDASTSTTAKKLLQQNFQGNQVLVNQAKSIQTGS